MEIFHALADPTRRRIVELLGRGEHTAGAIGEKFAVSAPAISQHLKVLREAQLVRVRAQGQHRIYSIDPAGLAELDAWLQRTRSFWAKSLDALERELAKPAVTPKNKTRRKR